MSQRTESVLTIALFSFIVLMSFFGMAYPLLNPGVYTEVLMNTHMIPLVQHHVDIYECGAPMTMIVDPTFSELSCDNLLV